MSGKTIRYIRKALGHTIQQFAQLLEVAPSTIYKWEVETHTPSKDAQKHIKAKLNITQEDVEEINRLLVEWRHSTLDVKLRAQAKEANL